MKARPWDEKEWLKTIGQTYNQGIEYPIDRKAFLEGYLKGCLRRVNWEGIDKDACVRYAKAMLEKLANQ